MAKKTTVTNETKNVQNAQVTNPEVKDSPYTLTTYLTKKGGTASLLFGFPTQEAAQALADKCAKSISATWRYGDTGEKRYALSMGTRYGEVAKTLCDALNNGDKKAIDKACKDSVAIYDKVVADGMAERAAKKAEREAKKKGQGAGSKAQEKTYTQSELAEWLRKLNSGTAKEKAAAAKFFNELAKVA